MREEPEVIAFSVRQFWDVNECAALLPARKLLGFETTGAVIDVEPQSIRDALLDFDAAECEWVQLADLPGGFASWLK